jgi:diguanylate cyclase (GGDEF)-like protein
MASVESWEEALVELRAEYLREGAGRLEEIDRLLNVLSRDSADETAFRDLLRRFHGFAGSGTSYGLPQITALALEGERECATLLARHAAPTAKDLHHWQALLGQLRATLDGAGKPGGARSAAAPAARPVAAAPDILVVDDDAELRKAVKRLATQEGMSVRSAETSVLGKSAIDERVPDGLVVGTRLPDGPGYDLVEHLRARPGSDLTAVLMVASSASFLDKVDAIHCGADGYFQKPVDWAAFQRRLQHLLERNKAEPARILYVEDDSNQAAFVRAVLQSAGYEVRICDDPKRFEADLTAFRPDLVLMDIVLPGFSGYDLARYVRQDERYAALPIVFLTTEVQMQARIETARAGGDGYIEKPVTPGLLLSDVAARIERGRFIRGLMNRDGLTRLLTHTAFLEQARSVLGEALRDPGRTVAWVMIDVDHFKGINDRYGHPVGDRVLSGLAALLRRRLRQPDATGRYGGEEFAVLIEGLGEPEAVRLVSRLLAEFAATDHHAADGSSFRVTFSAGVAVLTPASMDLDRWRKAADDALYGAKAAGRNRVLAASEVARARA